MRHSQRTENRKTTNQIKENAAILHRRFQLKMCYVKKVTFQERQKTDFNQNYSLDFYQIDHLKLLSAGLNLPYLPRGNTPHVRWRHFL